MAGRPDTGANPAMPAGACDCHVHIFGPADRFPYWPGRSYTPPDASLAKLQALHARLGIERTVIVHPSPYGTDNRVSLAAAAALGDRARVVAVIDENSVSDADLDAFHAQGVRGVRLNFASNGIEAPELARSRLEATARRIAHLGWHVQIFTSLDIITALSRLIGALSVPIVVDHFGMAWAAEGTSQPGFQVLAGLLREADLWIKLSAAYRISADPQSRDVDTIAVAFLETHPQRCIWGSDWPHPGHRPAGLPAGSFVPSLEVDDAEAIAALWRWCAYDAELFRRVLATNPATLYDFPPVPANSTAR